MSRVFCGCKDAGPGRCSRCPKYFRIKPDAVFIAPWDNDSNPKPTASLIAGD